MLMDENVKPATETEQSPDNHIELAHQPDNKKPNKKLIIVGFLVLIFCIGIALIAQNRKTTTTKQSATVQTSQPKGDVLTNQTYDCQPRNEHEWYRTDQTLVVDHSNPDILYVNIEWKGLYKSTDGGKTWTQKIKGIAVYARSDDKTKGCYGEYPVLRIDPTNPKRLILGVSGGGGGNLHPTNPNSQVGGVYQTTNGGESWSQMINDKMNFYVTDVAIDPKSTNIVYYGTASNPSSWTGADQDKIFVKEGLIYKTEDSGKKWRELPTGIGKHTGATSVMVNQSNPKEIVTTTFSANRQSADGSGTGLSSGKDTSVSQLGILKSVDGGASWATLAKTPDNAPIIRGFSSKNNFNNMFFVSSGSDMKAYIMTDGKTLKPSGKYMDIVAYDPLDLSGKHMLGYSTIAGTPTIPNLNLFESNDAGLSWMPRGTLPREITDLNNPKTRPSVIVWHPTDKNAIFMSGAGGHVWKSNDLGSTWTKLLDYTQLN